jgi:hypothetical protein
MNYTIGSIIKYIAFGDLPRTVKVTKKEPDVKHGKSGFSGTIIHWEESTSNLIGEFTVWGYDSQITEVITL